MTANDIELEYESFGDPGGEPMLLIMGLGTQLTGWPDSFCAQLADFGYRVIRYDNRDVGLSTRFDAARTPNIPLMVGLKVLGIRTRLAYSLKDMAADAVGLMDALGMGGAHVVGASMGGMIAQLIAGHYPERTLSLTSIMSTTGHRSLPGADRKATRALLSKPENPADPESVIARNVSVRQAVQSPLYPKDDEELWASAAGAFARGGYYPQGVARQLAAAIAADDRRRLLRTVRCPSLVIHGDADPLVRVECGIDTARHLPDCELEILSGMGHDFPEPLLSKMAESIHATASRA